MAEVKLYPFSYFYFFLEAMKELSTLKRELKCWENMFERTHGRKPNKVRLKIETMKSLNRIFRKSNVVSYFLPQDFLLEVQETFEI